jgi:hypothetical protein
MNLADSIRAKQFITAAISLFVLVALTVAMVGAFTVDDCEDGCAEESGDCCECICCPTKVVMNISLENSNHSEFAVFVCTVERTFLSGEQVWYSSIDHPPQNFA